MNYNEDMVAAALAVCMLDPSPQPTPDRLLRVVIAERAKHVEDKTVYVEQFESVGQGRSQYWLMRPYYVKRVDAHGSTYVSGPRGAFAKRRGGSWERVSSGPSFAECFLALFYPKFFVGSKYNEANYQASYTTLNWNGKPRRAVEFSFAYGEPHVFSWFLWFDASTMRPLVAENWQPDYSEAVEGRSLMLHRATFPVIRWGVKLTPLDFAPAGEWPKWLPVPPPQSSADGR